MSIDLARRLGKALNVKSETRVRTIDEVLNAYVRLTPQSPTTPSPSNIDAAQIISGLIDDARISESSVTQHEAALEIDWLQLTGVPSTFPPSAHNHNASDLNAGTLADARVAQSNVTQHQAALTLAATQLTSGVLANARVQQSNVTQHEAALAIDWMQLTSIPSTFTPSNHLTYSTWTPTDTSGAGLSLAVALGNYAKHEDVVIANFLVVYPVTADINPSQIGGLPFTVRNDALWQPAHVAYHDYGDLVQMLVTSNTQNAKFYDKLSNRLTNAALSGKTLLGQAIYRTT